MIAIVVLLIYLVINYFIANYMKEVAYAKGYDDKAHAWAFSFWLGIAGWIYVVALPDLVTRENQKRIIELLSNQPEMIGKKEEDQLPDL